VPRYTPLHSTSPFFFTEQMNMRRASFCPFFISSWVSMRLINEFGPLPSKIGRYIGNSAVCAEGTSVVCDRARSTTDNKMRSESSSARTANTQAERTVFSSAISLNLRGHRQLGDSSDFIYQLVTPEVIDECVARLQRMQRAICFGSLKQRPQLHKSMTAAA
jgi:hypothetical protein